jgi:hypothetical protein
VTNVTTGELQLITKEEIARATDLEDEIVPVPEWGEGKAVRVLALDVARRQAYFEFGSIVTRNGTALKIEAEPFALRDAALAVLSIVDADGRPMYTMAEIDALAVRNAEVIERIATVARRLSKLRPEDQETAKAAADPTLAATPSDIGSPES